LYSLRVWGGLGGRQRAKQETVNVRKGLSKDLWKGRGVIGGGKGANKEGESSESILIPIPSHRRGEHRSVKTENKKKKRG